MRPRITLYLLLLLSLTAVRADAQGENNIWIFGTNVGMDFNRNPPALFTVNGMGNGGYGAVSDASGRLLFYTNSDSVWNGNHRLMPNGTGLRSMYGAMQYPVIVRQAGDPNRYYLFTRDDRNRTLNYSVIDLSLDNGAGDIVPGQKNIVLAQDITTGLAAVPGDGCVVWLIAHRTGSPDFLVYRIDEQGVSDTPVTARSGFFSNQWSYYVCDLKVSPDRRKIAIASNGGMFVELHDFDPGTGLVSNAVLLDRFPSTGRAHSACFSPNSSRLYICGGPNGSDLLQYDLSTLPAVTATKINDSNHFNGGLRLGPDNRIYCSNWNGIYTVMQPDLPGRLCSLSFSYLQLPLNMRSRPVFMGQDMVLARKAYTSRVVPGTICASSTVTLHAPDGYSAYLWADGDTSRQRTFAHPGTIWLRSSAGCRVHTDTFDVAPVLCDCAVTVPSAFTPNNDGHNDRFRIVGTDVQAASMSIYNRYGQRIYYGNGSAPAWDGTCNGRPCDAGTYYYLIHASCIQGSRVNRKGEVQLLR